MENTYLPLFVKRVLKLLDLTLLLLGQLNALLLVPSLVLKHLFLLLIIEVVCYPVSILQVSLEELLGVFALVDFTLSCIML